MQGVLVSEFRQLSLFVVPASRSSSPMAGLWLVLVLVASPVLAVADENLRCPDNCGRCERTPSFNLSMLYPPEQTGQARPCAIPVLELQVPDGGGGGGGKIALALRPDTLGIIAFANGQRRQWYTFGNWRHLFPGATVLRFGDDYASQDDTMVKDLRVSRDSILQAAGVVEQYDELGPPGSDDGYLRRAMATLRLAIVEDKCYEGLREKILSRLHEKRKGSCVL